MTELDASKVVGVEEHTYAVEVREAAIHTVFVTATSPSDAKRRALDSRNWTDDALDHVLDSLTVTRTPAVITP